MNKLFLLIFLSTLFLSLPSRACTSVIISSRVSASGKPIMLKHRDSDYMDNRVERFNGPSYDFIALVNSSSEGGEAWTGTNTAGFSIMNTASYNIKDDDVPDSLMDREGILMYKALGVCATVDDFKAFLDTLSRPFGVEANFGVIDAEGGASYFEVNNHKWYEFNVNDIAKGYRVVTNFCENGRKEDVAGYERYLSAKSIMSGIVASGDLPAADHSLLFESFSRHYSNSVLGVDYSDNYDAMEAGGFFNGMAVDQDLIPRRITSASIVIEGVKKGENPLHTVMWTILGYPACSVAIPLLVGSSDHIPAYMKSSEFSENAFLCDKALYIKEKYVFPLILGNGKKYVNLRAVLKGESSFPSLLSCWHSAEMQINESFRSIYLKWTSGIISEKEFFSRYDDASKDYIDVYMRNFSSFLQ